MHSQSYIPELDGLRGIAILSVVFLHWFVQPLEALFSELEVMKILNITTHGVDLFFIISGFLIGRILLKVRGKKSGIISFYIRRILRIWPLYYLLLGITMILGGGIAVFGEIPCWSFLIFVSNYWQSAGLKFNSILGPIWSLAIEEQFYLIGPLFFFLEKKQIVKFIFVYLLWAPFFRLLISLNTAIDTWRFTPTRLDGILIGILIAIVFSFPSTISFLLSRINILKNVSIGMFVSVITSRIILPNLYWHSFGITAINISFGLIVTLVLIQHFSNQPNYILNSHTLRYLGLRCYSIYLFHMLFMIFVSFFVENFLIGLAVQIIITILFAHFSWKYIEIPPIRLGKKFQY